MSEITLITFILEGEVRRGTYGWHVVSPVPFCAEVDE